MVCGFVALLLAKRSERAVFGPSRKVLFAAFIISASALSLVGWAVVRSLPASLPDLGRGFPYPDHAILLLSRVLDRVFPSAPGNLKLQGEFPRIVIVLGSGCCFVAMITGFLGGLILNNRKHRKSSAN
jgi:hypothetical protein